MQAEKHFEMHVQTDHTPLNILMIEDNGDRIQFPILTDFGLKNWNLIDLERGIWHQRWSIERISIMKNQMFILWD